MFFLFIGSHGAEEYVCGSDGKLVELAGIYNLLSVPRKKEIQDKPKLVLIQACSNSEWQPEYFFYINK